MNEKMKYKVHRIDVKSDNVQYKLEQFLNNLDGEVLAVIPILNLLSNSWEQQLK